MLWNLGPWKFRPPPGLAFCRWAGIHSPCCRGHGPGWDVGGGGKEKVEGLAASPGTTMFQHSSTKILNLNLAFEVF